ncbi:hypothetical protein [Arthrobacter ramosus]|uniref:CDR ABC transporter domain-containing protein n=2 Tax=Arthrobacter ramosus TaxID=1672 RepID=A0ABV5XTT9_ARTRM
MSVGQQACSVVPTEGFPPKVRPSSKEAMMLGIQQTDAGMPDPGIYFQWGDFLIQFGNLMVIAIMVALFVLALVVPFPGRRSRK